MADLGFILLACAYSMVIGLAIFHGVFRPFLLNQIADRVRREVEEAARIIGDRDE